MSIFKKITLITFTTGILAGSGTPVFARYDITLDASLTYGDISGFSQIPRGGNIGTTSIERPSFSELGLKHDTFYRLRAGYDYQLFELYGTFSRIHLKKTRTLNTPLTTHSLTLPAGAAFTGEFDYQWYNLGLSYTYPLQYFQLVPSLDFNYLDYHYQFQSTASSERHFSSLATRAGLILRWPINPIFTATFGAHATLPISNLRITEANAALHWLVYDGWAKLTPYIGIGYLKIDFEDNQTVPNHYRYKMNSNFSIGLKARF